MAAQIPGILAMQSRATLSFPSLAEICSCVCLLCQGHLLNLIQVADNQIPISFYTGPGPQVGAVLDEEVPEPWMLWSPADGSRSGPLHMSTAHRRQVFQKSHTLEQSQDCTHESSVPSHWLCFPGHTCGDCELHTGLCSVKGSWGDSPPSTHTGTFGVNKSLLFTLKKPLSGEGPGPSQYLSFPPAWPCSPVQGGGNSSSA